MLLIFKEEQIKFLISNSQSLSFQFKQQSSEIVFLKDQLRDLSTKYDKKFSEVNIIKQI